VKKSLLILPLVLLASAFALSACGGGGSSSSSGGGDETAIEGAIQTSATSDDPSKCSEVQTEAFNEAESGETGEKALEDCEKEAEDETEPAESVTVSNIEVDGESATAAVAIEGGSLSGQEVEIGMAKEDGDWKLNELAGFVKYDPAGIASVMEEKLSEEEGIDPALATCISEGVAEMSQQEAEALIFEKSLEGVEEITRSCGE
jgi:hypothetical protein